jgi:hypothetical protein
VTLCVGDFEACFFFGDGLDGGVCCRRIVAHDRRLRCWEAASQAVVAIAAAC